MEFTSLNARSFSPGDTRHVAGDSTCTCNVTRSLQAALDDNMDVVTPATTATMVTPASFQNGRFVQGNAGTFRGHAVVLSVHLATVCRGHPLDTLRSPIDYDDDPGKR